MAWEQAAGWRQADGLALEVSNEGDTRRRGPKKLILEQWLGL